MAVKKTAGPFWRIAVAEPEKKNRRHPFAFNQLEIEETLVMPSPPVFSHGVHPLNRAQRCRARLSPRAVQDSGAKLDLVAVEQVVADFDAEWFLSRKVPTPDIIQPCAFQYELGMPYGTHTYSSFIL